MTQATIYQDDQKVGSVDTEEEEYHYNGDSEVLQRLFEEYQDGFEVMDVPGTFERGEGVESTTHVMDGDEVLAALHRLEQEAEFLDFRVHIGEE